MKILRLSAENIKRLSVVEITPDGQPIQLVAGPNGAGKSSLLDAIMMALGGASAIPAQPVRRGQTRGQVVLDLGDYLVTRSFTADGGTALKVTSADGKAKFSSPQALLDKLIGSLSFDPLAFERMDDKVQAATLRQLLGLTTDDLDTEAKRIYDDRTVVNRSVKQLEATLATLHAYPDAPRQEVSIAQLTDDLQAADASQRAVDQARSKYETAAKDLKDTRDTVQASQIAREELLAQLARLDDRISAEAAAVATAAAALETAKASGLSLKAAAIDPEPIRQRLREAESINQQVRANTAREEARVAIQEEKTQAQTLTDLLTAIEGQKRERLASVQMPVAGLAFSEAGGLLFDGLPFDQASQAQRLRVSVAVGLAANPQLKVLLVREGSALDSKSLQLLAELATEADAQIWVEVVRETPGEGVAVFIEDGSVRELEAAS